MEDEIENCHEWSLQAANQVLLLFGPIENPRWPCSNHWFNMSYDHFLNL
jgi:hypothetical protein